MNKNINPFMKASLLYIFFNVVGQGFTFLGIIVFTRIMTQADYGTYSTYYSMVSILVVLVGSNLYIAVDNAYIDYKREIYAYLKSVLVLATVVCMVVTCVIALGSFFCKVVPVSVIFLAVMHAFAFFVVNYRMYSANMENDYRTKSFLLVLPNLFQFLFTFAFLLVFQKNAVMLRIIGSTIGVAICAIACYISIYCKGGKGIVINGYWRYAIKISWPSIIMSLSYMLMQNCDKVMITSMCGTEDTAVYSTLYYIGYVIIAVNQGLSAVFQAWLYRVLDQKKTEQIKIIQKWYIILIAVLEAGMLMLSVELVKLILPSAYWEYEYIAPFIMGACLMVSYGFYTYIGMFYKKTGRISVCVVIAAVINIALNAGLLPRYGAVAACYTTVASYLILFVLIKFVAEKEIRGVYSGKMFGIFIAYTVTLCICFLKVSHLLVWRIILFGTVLLIEGIYCLKNKKEVLGLLRVIK